MRDDFAPVMYGWMDQPLTPLGVTVEVDHEYYGKLVKTVAPDIQIRCKGRTLSVLRGSRLEMTVDYDDRRRLERYFR